MQTFELNLFADYFQFYIQDDDIDVGDLSNAWTEDAVTNLLAETERAIGIGTVRNMDVPVYIQIDNELPNLNSDEWDKINETELKCETGRLVVAGCTDYYPDAQRIDLSPGNYKVVIGYKGLDTLSEDGLDGRDCYYLYISPINE